MSKIREDFSLTQDELAGNGIGRTDISKLENGKRKMTFKIAIKLARIINNVIDNKGLIAPYQITPELIYGTQKINTNKVLEKLRISINENIIKELDETYNKISIESHKKEYLIDILKILNNNIYENSELIRKYHYWLYNYSLTTNESIEVNMIIMRAYMIKGNYNEAISITLSIEEPMQKCFDRDLSTRFFYNLAICYHEIKEYEKAIKLIKFAKSLKVEKYKTNLLLIEGNILIMCNKTDEAIKIYKKVIKLNENLNITVLGYSNLSSIYIEKNKLNLADSYIEKALLHIDKVDLNYKCSVLQNRVIIAIKKDEYSLEIIEELYENLKILNSSAKNDKYINEITHLVLNNEELLVIILKTIKKYEIEIQAIIKVNIATKYKNNNKIINLLF